MTERSPVPVLEVEGLHKTFVSGHPPRRRPALRGVDLRVYAGETVGLVGESGSGKSTLARCALALCRPDAGRVRFRGTDLGGLSRRELRRLRPQMQMVFQDPAGSLNPRRTVGAQVAEAASRAPEGPGGAGLQRRVAELLAAVDLDPTLASRRPHALSGGQLQRVCIARAMATRPRLLVCDEPTSALDTTVQARILGLLHRLLAGGGLGALFVTHDLGVVRHLADRVYVAWGGVLLEEAPVEAFFDAPLHPCSRSLLERVPRLGGAAASPGAGRGVEPGAGRACSGFASRPDPPSPSPCPYRIRCEDPLRRCRLEGLPPWIEVDPGHRVRCWGVSEDG